MPYTNSWDEAEPDGAVAAAADIDTILQNLKVDIRERLITLLGIPDFLADPVAGAILNLKGAAASKIVPGATSLSLRNNADSADNVLVTDAGAVTVRDDLTVNGDANVVGTLSQNGVPVSVNTHTHDTDTLEGGTFPASLPLTFPDNITATKQVSTPIYDAGTSGSAKTLDFDNGVKQLLELTANCTFTFDNLTTGAVYQLLLQQDATGGRTVTWPASITWGTNGAPVLTTTANRLDVITLLVFSPTVVIGLVGGYGFTV